MTRIIDDNLSWTELWLNSLIPIIYSVIVGVAAFYSIPLAIGVITFLILYYFTMFNIALGKVMK